MRMLRNLAVSCMFLTLAAASSAKVFGQSTNKITVSGGASARLMVSEQMQIPGRVLEPGTYSIQIMDHLSDRMIIRVDQGGSGETTFLALPKSQVAKLAHPGPIFLSAKVKGMAALRGFEFPDGTIAEFVYPKAEAVALAKANNSEVVAIDPASEGRVTEPALSKQDMQMVTLWMLTPTPVGPDNQGAGIKAARYQQVASVHVPKPPRPAMAALPHTASLMPTFLLAGMIAFFGAGLLTLRRLMAAR